MIDPNWEHLDQGAVSSKPLSGHENLPEGVRHT
jgi:hypothetical protein